MSLAVLGAGAAFEKQAGSLPRAGKRVARGAVGPQAFGTNPRLLLNHLRQKKSEN